MPTAFMSRSQDLTCFYLNRQGFRLGESSISIKRSGEWYLVLLAKLSILALTILFSVDLLIDFVK